MEAERFLLVHEDHGTNIDTAENIAMISRDCRSWMRFYAMLAGGPPAVMTVQMEDKTTRKIKVVRVDDPRAKITPLRFNTLV